MKLEAPAEPRPTCYAFVNVGQPVICIAKNLKNWAEDEMILSAGEFGKNDAFVKRVAGVLSHETIHIVLENMIKDECKTSLMLDCLFGYVYINDDSTHGLWCLEDYIQ